MKYARFLRILEESGKPVFGVNDAAKIIGKNKQYTFLFLDRLRRRGLIARVERNKYALGSANPFCIASNIAYPAYISFLSGIRYYNLTTQIPSHIFVAVLRQRKGVEFEGYKIKFVKISKKKFFGYDRKTIGKKQLFVAEMEKLMLDCLYLPEHCPLPDTFSAVKEGIDNLDLGKLIAYGKQMRSPVVLKRLGYLLDKINIDIYGKIKLDINKKYDKLDPSLLGKGRKDKKWKLIENVEVDG